MRFTTLIAAMCATSHLMYSIDCLARDGAIDGQVIEEHTKNPVAGVIVTAAWEQTVGVFHSSTICVHAESAVTDARGEFHIHDWNYTRTISEYFTTSKPEPLFSAYKAGMIFEPVIVARQKGEQIFKVKPFGGTTDDHILYLWQSTRQCVDPEGALLFLNDSLSEEALRIAETPAQKTRAEGIKAIASEGRKYFEQIKKESGK